MRDELAHGVLLRLHQLSGQPFEEALPPCRVLVGRLAVAEVFLAHGHSRAALDGREQIGHLGLVSQSDSAARCGPSTSSVGQEFSRLCFCDISST